MLPALFDLCSSFHISFPLYYFKSSPFLYKGVRFPNLIMNCDTFHRQAYLMLLFYYNAFLYWKYLRMCKVMSFIIMLILTLNVTASCGIDLFTVTNCKERLFCWTQQPNQINVISKYILQNWQAQTKKKSFNSSGTCMPFHLKHYMWIFKYIFFPTHLKMNYCSHTVKIHYLVMFDLLLVIHIFQLCPVLVHVLKCYFLYSL